MQSRYAAKEAIMKAVFRTGRQISWKDILIWTSGSRAPLAAILSEQQSQQTLAMPALELMSMPPRDDNAVTNGANVTEEMEQHPRITPTHRTSQELDWDQWTERFMEELDGDMVDISISHERGYYAVAMALYRPPA